MNVTKTTLNQEFAANLALIDSVWGGKLDDNDCVFIAEDDTAEVEPSENLIRDLQIACDRSEQEEDDSEVALSEDELDILLVCDRAEELKYLNIKSLSQEQVDAFFASSKDGFIRKVWIRGAGVPIQEFRVVRRNGKLAGALFVEYAKGKFVKKAVYSDSLSERLNEYRGVYSR